MLPLISQTALPLSVLQKIILASINRRTESALLPIFLPEVGEMGGQVKIPIISQTQTTAMY